MKVPEIPGNCWLRLRADTPAGGKYWQIRRYKDGSRFEVQYGAMYGHPTRYLIDEEALAVKRLKQKAAKYDRWDFVSLDRGEKPSAPDRWAGDIALPEPPPDLPIW